MYMTYTNSAKERAFCKKFYASKPEFYSDKNRQKQIALTESVADVVAEDCSRRVEVCCGQRAGIIMAYCLYRAGYKNTGLTMRKLAGANNIAWPQCLLIENRSSRAVLCHA